VTSRQVVEGSSVPPAPAVNKTRLLAQTVAVKAVAVLLGAMASVVISHALGPQGRGAYYVVTTVASTAIMLGGLSLDRAQVTLWIDAPNRRAVTANSVGLGPVVGIVAAAVAAVIVVELGPGAVPIPGLGLLAIALIAVPAGTTVIYVINVLTLRSQMNAVNRCYLVGALAQCLPLIILGLSGTLSVGWVVIIWTMSMGLPLVLLLPALRGSGVPDLLLARRTLGLGLRYHAGTAASYLLLRVDIFILNALEPTTAAVGLYSLAVTLAELTKLLTDAIVPVMMPEQVQTSAGHAAAVTAATVRMATLFSGAAIALMCLIAPALIPLIYGPAFRGAGPALIALAPGLLALGATNPVRTYLFLLSRPGPMSLMFIAVMAANVGLNFALIPRFGIIGASLASSVAYTLLAGTQTGWFVKATGIRPPDLIPGLAEIRLLRERLPTLAAACWPG
jgi:O-antigen/teichoic acid export membrane protein